MNRNSLYVAAPPFMHVERLGDDRPPLGAIILVDAADRPATAEELRELFNLAPWCPVCVLVRSAGDRRRLPRSPRMCSVSALVGGGGAASILAAVRERPRPAPMDMAEWLAARVRLSGLRTPLVTLFGRAVAGGSRNILGDAWSDARVTPLGAFSGTDWQEVARLADLAVNREAMGRVLVRHNALRGHTVRAMANLLGANEDEFRERAGWEWVFEAALRRSREQVCESVTASMTGPLTPATDRATA